MKHCFLLGILSLFLCNASESQSLRSFKGRVVDSLNYKPLPDATVSIFRAKDTLLLNFGFTTPNGNFSISTKTDDSLLIIISLLNYKEHTKRVEMSSGQWSFHEYGDIKLTPLPVSLRGFTLNSSAIRMKGDTIEINASRFKVLPGSDVAQLFKKIPGFEISVKGEVKVNGVNVSKITVDGSDFFGNNPGLVSKNLNADMVETVQVFEDRNPDGSPKEEPASVINLKLKKGKRNGSFGDLIAGYGTDGRYEAGARLNQFKNDRKISFILNSNNINETGFDFGFENWHNATQISRNGISNDGGFVSGAASRGNINNKTGGGLTYFNEFKGKRKLSFNLFINRNDFNSITASTGINALNDSLKRINTDSSESRGLALNAFFEINYSKEIDSTGEYDFGISTSMLDITNRKEAGNRILLNESVINKGKSELLRQDATEFIRLNGSYKRSLRKDGRYYFFLAADYNAGRDRNDFYQYLLNNSDTFNNLNERNQKNREWMVKLTGSMPLTKKLSLNISGDRWHRDQSSLQQVRSASNRYAEEFEQEYIFEIDSLNADIQNKQTQLSVKPFLSFRSKKLYSQSGVTLLSFRMIRTGNTGPADLIRNYTKWLPYYTMSYYPGKAYFYLSVSKTTSFPVIAELMPVPNLSNNYDRTEGNPDLEPTDRTSLRTYGSLHKLKGFRYFYFGAGFHASDNEKIWVNKTLANGVNARAPENASGMRSANIWLNLSKKVNKTLNLVFRNSVQYNKNPQKTDQLYAFGVSRGMDTEAGFNFSFLDSLEFTATANWSGSDYNNTLNNTLNYRQNVFSYSAETRFILPIGTEVSSNLLVSDQRNVPGIGRIVPLWNAYIQQPVDKKNRYHLKLTAFDILRQNTNIARTVNGNFIYISENNQLQRYFMLSLVYKIKKVGGEETFDYVY